MTYELKDPQDPTKITHQTIECNTVLLAIGRDPYTKNMGLGQAGVKFEENGKIPAVYEQTNVPHIFALGDVLKDKLELTPVAIRAGVLLAKRLFGGSQE
ncbi:FAD-dependent oxidoreductase, partial [Salmonella sp. s51228]|uniref:FAD-dependent oxidoreductase n=1 Tax=Salmonella sp. s51228 TaxID=3159652 RepID=UPI00397EF076